MKNHETNIRYSSPTSLLSNQAAYIEALKSQLLKNEIQNLRHLIDAPFTGGPRFMTVIGSAGQGKTATLLWLAVKHFYLLPNEKLTIFSEVIEKNIALRLEQFGFKGAAEITMKTPNYDDIHNAIGSSGVVIIDQPIAHTDFERVTALYKLAREACFKDNKYHKCRGVLFGIQGVRHEPASPATSQTSVNSSDIVFHTHLRPNNGEAPFLKATKSRFLTTELPEFYMIPQQIIAAMEA